MSTTKTAVSAAVAALSSKLGLSDFQSEMLADTLASLPPVVAGQHADAAAPEVAVFDNLLALEDILGSCGVFTNMFNGRPCSAASYGTILGYNAFDDSFALIGADRFSKVDWIRIIGYYRHNRNLSPVLAQLAGVLARKVGFPNPLEKDDATVAFYAGRLE